VRAAAGGVIAFTDSDCIVDRAWLSELVRGLTPGVACAGGIIAAPPATNDFEAYCSEFSAKSQKNAIERNAALFPYINTANAIFRREVFDAVGWFDERFTWAGGEDLDFGWRVHWAGYAMRYLPGARVEHRHRSGPGQLFQSYYRYGRGWVMTVRKHSRRIQAMPPMIAGLGVGDVKALFRALGHGAWNVLSLRDRRERRYGYYRVLRHLGECCGRIAASL
jgi:GT2 family glycosyltransferase